MLLRGSNAVGYTNYPDNVVQHFVAGAAASAGIDVFRIFDSLNWVRNMRVAIEAVCEAGSSCEAAICYTGDILDPKRAKYDLKYYVELAKELEKAGCHILAIKDMAGLCKPCAAEMLFNALKRGDRRCPIHFHTHDTCGHRRRHRAGGGRSRGRHRRRGDGRDVGHHLAAQPGLDRRGAAPAPTRSRHRSRGASADRRSTGRRCARSTPPSKATSRARHCRGLSPRNARRPVHEPESSRPGRMGLETRWHEVAKAYRRGQPTVRRHRQGDAVLQGGRRHGPADGQPAT